MDGLVMVLCRTVTLLLPPPPFFFLLVLPEPKIIGLPPCSSKIDYILQVRTALDCHFERSEAGGLGEPPEKKKDGDPAGSRSSPSHVFSQLQK